MRPADSAERSMLGAGSHLEGGASCWTAVIELTVVQPARTVPEPRSSRYGSPPVALMEARDPSVGSTQTMTWPVVQLFAARVPTARAEAIVRAANAAIADRRSR